MAALHGPCARSPAAWPPGKLAVMAALLHKLSLSPQAPAPAAPRAKPARGCKKYRSAGTARRLQLLRVALPPASLPLGGTADIDPCRVHRASYMPPASTASRPALLCAPFRTLPPASRITAPQRPSGAWRAHPPQSTHPAARHKPRCCRPSRPDSGATGVAAAATAPHTSTSRDLYVVYL